MSTLCYPVWTAYADTDYRNKTSLVSIYLHIPLTRVISNQESESLIQSFHPASWVYFEFRKKRIWLELRGRALDLERYATNHGAGPMAPVSSSHSTPQSSH